MNTIFDAKTIQEFKTRINLLSNDSKAQWGKMTSYQMAIHCIASEKMYLNEVRLKRLFVGKLFGGMARKKMLGDDQPLGKNAPTHPTFKKTGRGNLAQAKSEWISLIDE